MPTYIVNVREVWIQPVVIVARDEEDALEKVLLGDGHYIESALEYSHRMSNSSDWEIEEEQ